MLGRLTRLYACCLLLLCLLAALQPSHAQGGNTIEYGQTVNGRITNDSFRVVYRFNGRKGDIIDVLLKRSDPTLDPLLLLEDDQQALIARSDDSSPELDAAIISQPLPRDGVYFLVVTRFGQERGLTTGGFSLSLSRAGAAAAVTNQTLQYGDSIVGEINTEQFQVVYAFRATRGDILAITMQRISGTLDPFLILADTEGNILIANDEDSDSPGSLDAAIRNLRVLKTGTYLLVSTRFGRQAGESKGGFSLTLDRLSPESLGKVPDKAIMLDYGATATGAIDSENVMRFYQIEAKKGDVLTITAERTKGNLDPILVLYTRDLRELTAHDSGIRGQNARISGFAVPNDGFYTLMVSRFNREKGITAGNFSLSVVGRTGVTLGPGGKFVLPYGGASNAIISDGNLDQQYVFTGSEGDVITVSMVVTSGNLLPQLLLLDPNGKVVDTDDPGTGEAKLARIKLNSAGTYTIIATRRGRDKGNTQGAYLLLLTAENPK